MENIEVRHERIKADGVELHVARSGRGPAVILLHGFPENWRSWQRQIPALVHAGFSVGVPDLRGYNLSDIPPGRDAYRLGHLVADVAALVHAMGEPRSRAHIVGHDWGGIIAWEFASQHPEMVDKLVILNAPHPDIYARKVRRLPQMLRSWYVMFFQLPWLPEKLLAANRYGAVRKIFRRSPARAGAFSREESAQYVEAMSKPGALTAALNYYRANFSFKMLRRAPMKRIEAPTLVIWGELDSALGVELLDGLECVVPGVQIHRIPDASHWVQNEAPGEVNRALIDFLTTTK
jgi:pimeloyl-ACP methyl ester carboxylesterase